MPQFVPKPPQVEARPFTGDPVSVLDIQGWLNSQGVDSEFDPATGTEGEDGYTAPRIVAPSGIGVIEVGEWLMLSNDGFQVISASELYKNYNQV